MIEDTKQQQNHKPIHNITILPAEASAALLDGQIMPHLQPSTTPSLPAQGSLEECGCMYKPYEGTTQYKSSPQKKKNAAL